MTAEVGQMSDEEIDKILGLAPTAEAVWGERRGERGCRGGIGEGRRESSARL